MILKFLLPTLFFSSLCYPDPSPLVNTASKKSIITNLEKRHILGIGFYTNILSAVSDKKMALSDIIKEVTIWEEAKYTMWLNDPYKDLYRQSIRLAVIKEIVRPDKEILAQIEKYEQFINMLIVIKRNEKKK